MIDYSFSMQSCKSSLSAVQCPFCKGYYAGTNDLNKWQQSISTLRPGLLILQVIRLMNDPGAELVAESALITLRMLHLGSVQHSMRFADSGQHRRPTGGFRYRAAGNVDNLLRDQLQQHCFMSRWCMETVRLMSHTGNVFHESSVWGLSLRKRSLDGFNLFRHVLILLKCFEGSASAGLLSDLFWPSPVPPDYLSLELRVMLKMECSGGYCSGWRSPSV